MTLGLYNKNFNILVLGQMISLFGSAIQRFALSLYLLDLTGSASIFASILALSMIPIVVLSPIAGILADRGNKKNLMVILDSISAGLLVFYAIILFSGQDTPFVVAVVMLLLSAFSTLYQPVVNTSIPLVVDEKHLVKANAIIQQVASLSNFIGPILAGMLYGLLGIEGVIFINLISFIIAAIMECFLKIPHKKLDKKTSLKLVFVDDMRESYQYLRHENPIIFRMLLFSGLYNLCLVPVFSIVSPYLLKVTFGFSAQVYGIAEGMIALGMIIGGAIITWKPAFFHIKQIHRLLYITSIGMALMGLSIYLFQTHRGTSESSLVLFTIGGMVIMGILGIANVLSAAYIYKATDQRLLGKTLAFGSAFATLCIPIGQMTFGLLMDLFTQHLYGLVWLAAVSVLGVTLLVRWNVSQIKGD